MSLSALEYLRHILEEADYLMTQAQGVTKARFDQDGTLKPVPWLDGIVHAKTPRRLPVVLTSGLFRSS